MKGSDAACKEDFGGPEEPDKENLGQKCFAC
jgi:hypothetical protein